MATLEENTNKLRDILMDKVTESLEIRYELLEKFSMSFLAETGLKATECELVEKYTATEIVYYFRKRELTE